LRVAAQNGVCLQHYATFFGGCNAENPRRQRDVEFIHECPTVFPGTTKGTLLNSMTYSVPVEITAKLS
jgi:hypothetical protein